MKARESPGAAWRGDASPAVPAAPAAAGDTVRVAGCDAGQAESPGTCQPTRFSGPLRAWACDPAKRLMSAVIRKLSASRVADPRIALGVSGIGLLLTVVVGA